MSKNFLNSEDIKEKPGYHLREIEKGILGELSKIQEELDELRDAESQSSKIMVLVELSDLIGAIDAYLKHNALGITINDLIIMSNITKRAFENGRR